MIFMKNEDKGLELSLREIPIAEEAIIGYVCSYFSCVYCIHSTLKSFG